MPDRSDLARWIIAGAREGIVVLDREGRVRAWNPFMETLFGISAREVEGRKLQERFRSVRESPLPAQAMRAYAGEESTLPDLPLYAKRLGRLVWVSIQFQPLDDAEGRRDGVLILVRDVSERRAAEQALRDSEERLRLVMEATGNGLWEYDLGNPGSFWSPRMRAMLGYGQDGPTPPPDGLEALIHPADRARVRKAVVAHLHGGPPWEDEVRIRLGDGSWHWFLARGVAQRDPQGRPIRLVGAIDDVTERKQAEEALRRSEMRLRQIVSTEIVAIFVCEEGGRILEANDAYLRLTGYTREDLEAGTLDWRAIRSPEAREDLVRTRGELAAHGVSKPVETTIVRRDGTRVQVLAMVSLFPDPDAQERGLGVAFLIDLSERKRLESELLQAQKMESLGRLAGGLAHDFNNLLTAILGHLDLAESASPPGADLRTDLREARRGAERAAELVRQLLGFARKQQSRPQAFDLNALVDERARMLRALLREDVSLSLELAANLGAVRADPSQIEQVLLNLVVNARDAVPAAGRVIVSTGVDRADGSAEPTRPELPPGRYAVLVVRDTGAGMDPEVRARAFEPFFTTKQPGQGTGLGLSSVYGIVKQAGGDVRIESRPGRGTTVTVWLPLADEPALATARAPAVQHADGRETVLLVEDEPVVRGLIARSLAAAGYRVLEATNGAEALRVARDHPQAIDLLLTDVVMPRISGGVLAERLAEERPGLRILFMSGHHDETGLAAARGGRPELLAKPFTMAELKRRVRATLDGPL